MLVILPSKLVSLRIGITTSHSVGNAINRNRARRRIRASVDKILPSICTGFDIVFVARKQIIDVKFGDIFLTMHSLLEKAGVLVKQEELSGENWIGLPE